MERPFNYLDLLLCSVLIASCTCMYVVHHDHEVELNYSTSHPGVATLYFSDTEDFSQERRVNWETLGQTGAQTYRVSLPFSTRHIRVDLTEEIDRQQTIKSATVTTFFESFKIESFKTTGLVPTEDSSFLSVAPDSSFRFAIASSNSMLFLVFFGSVLISGVGLFVIGLMVSSTTQLDKRRSRVIVLFVVIGAVVFLTAGGLHRASISVWDSYLPPDEPRVGGRIYGSPLNIRSDEWAVHSPDIYARFSAEESPNWSAESLMKAIPGSHFSVIGQPKHWGWLFLPIDQAFGWLWTYKTVGLLIGLWLLFFALTSSHFYAAVGTTLIFGSSYVQWWFSSNLPEILMGFCISVAATIQLARTRAKTAQVAWGVLLFLGLTSTLLQFYPPFIVPLVPLGILLVYTSIRPLTSIDELTTKLFLVMAASIAALTLVVLTLADATDVVTAVRNTDYPGSRFSLGGDLQLVHLIMGIFEFWRTTEAHYPELYSNAAESGHFLVVYPLVLTLVSIHRVGVWKDLRILTISMFCLCLAIFVLAGIPEVLSKYTGMIFVPSDRAIFAFGLACVIGLVVMAAKLEHQPFDLKLAASSSLQTFGLIVAIGYWLGETDPFFDASRIFASALIVSALLWSLLRGNKLLLATVASLVAAPSLLVNPIDRGTGSLLAKPVFETARNLSSSSPNPTWMVFGETLVAQAFKANGFDVLGGYNYVPDLKLLSALDPEESSKKIWNRYARVDFIPSLQSAIQFEQKGIDYYQIHISPCSKELGDLGVTHVASPTSLDIKTFDCLEPANDSPRNTIHLYRLVKS